MDNDTIASGAIGGETIFGGQGDDTITTSGVTTAANDVHVVFGNLGNDVITATGSHESIFGGQGNDTITATASAGGNTLHGDLGNDTIFASSAGGETIFGGQGADSISAGAHTTADYYVYASNDSTAPIVTTTTTTGGASTSQTGTTESNLDHISGFVSGQDHILLAGHGNLTVSTSGATNLTTFNDTTSSATTTDAEAFQAAYTYAYGDGTASHISHIQTEYLAVQETTTTGTETFIFTQDHQSVALVGNTAASLMSNDIITG